MANSEHLKVLSQGVELWNKWREENPAEKPDLARADLTGVNLADANLMRTNLFDTHLRSVDLTNASLDHAVLTQADLTGAKLPRANLMCARADSAYFDHADLRNADMRCVDLDVARLRCADLAGAKLEGAKLNMTFLSGANLTGACFGTFITDTTIICDVDLSKVNGLELAKHNTGSHITIDTIYKSEGKIPEAFLRGCGVPEGLITYLPSLLGNAFDYYSCFISYSHEERLFARRLHDALQGWGIRCWLDEHQVLPGHDIFAEVDRGIRLWDKVLLCATKQSLTSWWVDTEIKRAFAKEQELTRQRGQSIRVLIPLNLDGYLFSWKDPKAHEINTRLAADFTGWESDNNKFEEQFERLVKALRTDEGREPAPSGKL